MDKKQKKGGTNANRRTVQGTTLREENRGKKHVDSSSMLRMEHLQRLATWASVEAGIPPLGALFGHRLATCAETEGVPLDPSTFVCHRCESILQPGFNCTVRIKKNVKKKAKRRKKSHIPSQNNVVYECHFCSYHNLLRGTQRGYVKSLLPTRLKPETESKVPCSSSKKMNSSERKLQDKQQLDRKVAGEIPSISEPASESMSKVPEADAVAREASVEETPLTLLERLTNSSKKKRKRNGSAQKKTSESGNSLVSVNSAEGTAGSSKRKKKGWSSLKEIAESKEAQSSRSISNFAIPFLLQVAK